MFWQGNPSLAHLEQDLQLSSVSLPQSELTNQVIALIVGLILILLKKQAKVISPPEVICHVTKLRGKFEKGKE